MRVSWVLVGILGMFTVSSGFALDRSVPIGWKQTGPFEKNLNGRIQVTEMEKILKASEAKKSIKPENETPGDQFREKRSELLASENLTNWKAKELEEFKDDIHFPMEENSSSFSKESETEKPRNVVLLFIDDSGQDHQELWKDLQTSNNFPVHGFLQSCRNEGFRLPLDESLVFGQKYHCECENFLRANVASLLSWAHRAKEMTTGAVSATNFSIPSALGYESPIFRRNSEESEENKMKILKPQLHDEWHLIDVDKEGTSSVSPSASSTPKQEGERMWDVFNTFSKIRIAFFRNWLETLHKNEINRENEFSARKPIPLESNLVELMRDTVEKLKSISNDKGFIMVGVAPGNKISPAIEILQTEISPKDTLLVVSGICSQDRKLVPFFANGPGSKYIHEAKTIWDLTSAVRKAVSGCQGVWCKVESLNPIWAPDHEFHRRFARGKNSEKVEPSLTTAVQNITETAKVSNASIVNTENSTVDHSQHNKIETSSEKSAGKSTEKSAEQTAEKSTEESAEKSIKESAEKSTEKSAEKSTEKSDETATEKSAKRSTEQLNEKSKETTTLKSTIKPSERLKENPKENTTEKSSEKPPTEGHNVEKNPKSENTTNVEVDQRMLSTSGASGFSMETTAIMGAITSFAATIFLDF